MSAQSNIERQKAYREMQKDPIHQENKFVNSRAANISPYVQFALSLQELFQQKRIDQTLMNELIENAMKRVEECDNILVARSLKRRMEGFADEINNPFLHDESVTYYIYRNWAADKKAVIHTASCSFCKHGKGLQNNTSGAKNGAWSQEYLSYEDAKVDAEKPFGSHDNLVVKNCSVCLKYAE